LAFTLIELVAPRFGLIYLSLYNEIFRMFVAVIIKHHFKVLGGKVDTKIIL